MPVTYSIHPKQNFAHVVVSGDVTAPELVHQAIERSRDPAYRPGMNTLYDMRDTNFTGDLRELHRLAFFMETVQVPSRTALVTQRPSVIGIARMFEQLASKSAVTYRTFESMEKACAWLEIPLPEE